MSFIDKDQRITSWQTKTKDNFIETSVTASFLSSFFQGFFHLDLNCFVQWKTSLALRGHISVAYFFFPCHQDLFIFLFYRIAVSCMAFVLGFSVKFGPTCLPLFPSHRPLIELLMLRKPTKSSWFLEDIRVPFDFKQQIDTKH